MSKLRSPINYKSLELELQEALKADELYKLQNDAKLRAVEQNVPTYEDFREMVNAAHLTPIKWNDAKPKIKKSWNPMVRNNNNSSKISFEETKEIRKSKAGVILLNESDTSLQNKIPTTFEEFVQVWRIVKGSEAKFCFLKSLRHSLQEKIFRTEIPLAMLTEIIQVCLQNIVVKENIDSIVEILHTLSKCKRFSLAVNFMGQNEKNICTRLFRDLLTNVENQNNITADAIQALALVYEIVIQ